MARRDEQVAPKKAYAHEGFPTWRHHPVRESKMVSSQGQLELETPDSDGWSDKQVVVPVQDTAKIDSGDSQRSTPARTEAGDVMRAAFNVNFDQMQRTNHDLIARNIQINSELDAAYADISALRNQNQALKVEIEGLKARKPSATQFQRKAPAEPPADTAVADVTEKAAE